ncbi:hypothetical protein [Tianweitania sediminis]|uniref:Uncharacterized protein n=1 Tax=Tianweitania sediminis TaxID=1502156 RepID=A0A8J7UM24_9HYPH|nr:hypothetical protein [Tianweitania sediminis]MBP0439897.1 hypothetical protein [Tianweitania sediminis]
MKPTSAETLMVTLPSLRMYELAAKRDAPPATIADMTAEQRREYDRRKRSESRARHREAAAAGAPEASLGAVRDALADAAIMLLAVGGPGSEEIKRVLGKVFEARPGVVLKAATDAKRGKLRPKFLKA